MGRATAHAREAARPRLAHEPALDGLRGVALVLVVLFHGGVGLVGGALGVDLFLVLSGYLITALLLAEHDGTGGVDLPAFWARRARRLLPAVLALVAAVAVHAAVTGDASRGLRLDGLATLGWWSNWRFVAAEQGYFEAFAAPSPLRHTWSLAVEEQWYLLWPPLLVLLRRGPLARRPVALAGAVVGLAAASALAMAAVAGNVDRAHFGTDTRAQGLLAGAALAVALRRWPVQAWRRPARAAATGAGVAGAAVVGWMAWRVPGTEPWLYRGGHSLVAAGGAALVAACVLPGGPVRRALSLRPLQAVGRRSYGAYLWHWPLFVWVNADSTGLDPWPLLGVRCALTTAATVASWHLVEAPVLEGRARLPRPRLALAGGFAAALALLLVGTGAAPGVRSSSAVATAEPTLPAGFQVDAAPPPTVPGVLDSPPAARPRDGSNPSVLVVGDSGGWSLGWAVEPVEGVEVSTGAGIGCGLDPAPVEINGVAEAIVGQPVPCPEMAGVWRAWAERVDPDVVVLVSGAWEVYDRELPGGRRLEVGTPAWAAWVDESLERVGADLAVAAPHAVVAVADVPCFDERDLALGGPSSPRNDPDRIAAVNAVLDRFVARHPARVVALRWSPWLCGRDAYERPDGIHLSTDAAHAIWQGPMGDAVRAIAATLPST